MLFLQLLLDICMTFMSPLCFRIHPLRLPDFVNAVRAAQFLSTGAVHGSVPAPASACTMGATRQHPASC